MNQITDRKLTKQHSGIPPNYCQRFKMLNENDLDNIHNAALRIIRTTGVQFDSPKALSLLKSVGADIEGANVRIPERIINKAIESAPSKVTLFARDSEKNVYLGEGNIHFTSGFGATWVRDSINEPVREANIDDLINFTRLADALDLVHIVLFAVVPQDISSRMLDVICTAEVLQNTSKHVQLSLESAELMDYVLKIARAVVGNNDPLPISSGGVSNSPLHYSKDVCEKYMRLARENVPCFIVCGSMAGATAPVTLAGMLAQQTAEFLAGLVLHQSANPGAPVVYGTFSGGFDMRYLKMALGGPEVSVITCATQQLCDNYGIPLGYATGGVTDSPVSDIQAGIEKTFGVLSAALAGVDVIHDGVSGLLGGGMLSSLGQQLIDYDMCASIAYFLKGLPVSESLLAEDTVNSVGSGGNFMMTDHTVKEFRESLYITPLRARNLDPLKTQEEQSFILNKAYKEARKIIASHQPNSVGDERKAEINRIIDNASEFISNLKGG